MFMLEADVRFTNMTRDNILVTDKHPSQSGIRMHELCIDWSLGTPCRFKVVISRPVYFTRSFSGSVNF
jgi:hypothetical protein